MKDSFGRTIDYLRVSLTDRCNFRCVYCMPEEGFPPIPKAETLTNDELLRLLRVAGSLGIRKVRLTGGEPLLRKDLVDLVRSIKALGYFEDISLTTNGHLLESLAEPLVKAGLSRINVSLDTLREDRFQAIARRGSLDVVMSGIRAAQAAGLSPLKINCVLMKGVNDDEAPDLAAWTLRENVHVRFIEVMPIRWNLDEVESLDHGDRLTNLIQIKPVAGTMLSDAQMRKMYVAAAEVRASIEAVYGPMEPAELKTNGPARTYKLAGSLGTVGFISQISSDFCEKCNRLRLTHDGYLRPCLMSDGELNLREPLRSGISDSEVAALFEHVVKAKPERHYLAEGQKVTSRGMSQIGG